MARPPTTGRLLLGRGRVGGVGLLMGVGGVGLLMGAAARTHASFCGEDAEEIAGNKAQPLGEEMRVAEDDGGARSTTVLRTIRGGLPMGGPRPREAKLG